MPEKEYWQIDSAKLARDILDLTRTAKTEEDVKMRVEPVLRKAFREIGVDVGIAEYEKTTALTAKRMDAVYGYVVIEYKSPGKLASVAAVQRAKDQLKTYLEEESLRHGADTRSSLEKAVGIALDDRHILFARYSKTARILSTPVPIESEQGILFPEVRPQHGFQFQGPFPINASSLTSLLIYARSAANAPLRPQIWQRCSAPGTKLPTCWCRSSIPRRCAASAAANSRASPRSMRNGTGSSGSCMAKNWTRPRRRRKKRPCSIACPPASG